MEEERTDNKSSGRNDRGNDLASNELGLEAINSLDAVGIGAKIRRRVDEVNVEVGVVVLLKADGVHAELLDSLQRLNDAGKKEEGEQGESTSRLGSFVLISFTRCSSASVKEVSAGLVAFMSVSILTF